MKRRFVEEASRYIADYFDVESVGNRNEDVCNIADFLESRFGFLFDIIEEDTDVQ